MSEHIGSATRAKTWPPAWDYDNGSGDYRHTSRDVEPPADPLLRLGIVYVIEQGTWWVPAKGTPLWLPTMSHQYKANVQAFLLRRAAAIEFSYALANLGHGSMLGGEAAQDAFEQAMDEHDAEVARIGARQWLSERPLLRELTYQIECAAYDGPIS